jgi:hypothetical protein
MRFDNLCKLHFGQPFVLMAAAFSILLLVVLDRVLLAGGPLLCGVLSRVVGWPTLGSDCFILQSSDHLLLPIG